jgi:CubicO group peptidase (beta-lactamase class C family)
MSSFLFSINSELKSDRDEEKIKTIKLKLDQVTKEIKDLQNKNLLDGEILIVQEDQELLHELSQDIRCFKEPKFMIGSLSKQFFAVALLKALYDSSLSHAEEEKIRDIKAKLQEPLSVYLPEKSSIWSDNMPAWACDVSLHHLLNHTSGIPNFTEVDEFSAEVVLGKKFYEFPHSSADIIQLVSSEDLLFKSGERFSYSNTGYIIIAEVIEAITKKSVSKYIQESLFDPIGLSSTTHVDKGKWDELKSKKKYANLVPQWKYDPTGDKNYLYPLSHCEDMSVAKGGGSIISSARDLLKWNQALHKRHSIIPVQLYDIFISESLDKNGKKIEYGYGIGIDKSELGKVLIHKGRIGAYQTFLCYFPSFDLSIILLSHISYDIDKVEEEFKELLLNLEQTIPDKAERTQKALKIIFEKYPSARGFEKIMDKLQQLLNK